MRFGCRSAHYWATCMRMAGLIPISYSSWKRCRMIFYVSMYRRQGKVMSIWDTQSDGHIQGVCPEEEESGSFVAPAAAAILSPYAVACFIACYSSQTASSR